MNMMQIMQQAQKMQKKFKEMQEELSEIEVSGESAGGVVQVICNGQGKFKSVKLKPEAINPEDPSSVDADTLETLEDLIIEAAKAASDKAQSQMEAKMKSVTGGVNIPGLF